MRIASAFVLIAFLFAAPAASGADPATDGPGEIAAGLRRDVATWQFLHVDHRIEIVGDQAFGTLSQEFFNESDTALETSYAAEFPRGCKVQSIALEVDGFVRLLTYEEMTEEEQLEREFARLASQPRSRRGVSDGETLSRLNRVRAALDRAGAAKRSKARDSGPPRNLVTEPFEIAARGYATVRVGFLADVKTSRGHFFAALPAVRDTGPVSELPGRLPPTLDIRADVLHDKPLLEVLSTTHEIDVSFERDRTVIVPDVHGAGAAAEFRFEFATARDEAPTLTATVPERPEDRGRVDAVLHPPQSRLERDLPPLVRVERESPPLEVVFVVDSSASMARYDGFKHASRAVSACVGMLDADDRFNVIEFDDEFSVMSPRSMVPDGRSGERVRNWLGAVDVGGGTRLLPALTSTLIKGSSPVLRRTVVVISDGGFADKDAVFRLIEERPGEARLFAVGIGPSEDRQTLLRLAELGRGRVELAARGDRLGEAVRDLFASVLISEVESRELDRGEAAVEAVSMSELSSSHAGRPLACIGCREGRPPSYGRSRSASGGRRP